MRRRRPGRFYTWQEWEDASSARLTARDRRAIRTLCRQYMDPIRLRFGPTGIISAKRSPERNAAVGGASRSYHLYDLRPGHAACDFTCDDGSPHEWDQLLTELGASYTESAGDHAHADTRDLPRTP